MHLMLRWRPPTADPGENEVDQEMGDDTGAPASVKGEIAFYKPHRPPAVERALKILVRNATEEFGFAPRGVYDSIFRQTRQRT